MSGSDGLKSGGKVACIGAGNIGRAWAIVFARAGYDVALFDQDPEALDHARTMLQASVAGLVDAGELDDGSSVLARIAFEANIESVLRNAAYVQESITERVEEKRQLFVRLGELCPAEVILASSTSELAPSTFMNVTRFPERCLVAHPVNPPYLIPLVEICPAPQTGRSAIESVRQMMEKCGMQCVVLTREINGFILNRIQAAVLGEAFYLVENGYCSPQDMDFVLTHGLARRWVFIGPLMTAHLNAREGFDQYIEVLGPAWQRLIGSMRRTMAWSDGLFDRISAELEDKVPVTSIAEAQMWRDRRLMALNRHLAAQPGFRSTRAEAPESEQLQSRPAGDPTPRA